MNGLTWWQARELAKTGKDVRREAWPSGRWVSFRHNIFYQRTQGSPHVPVQAADVEVPHFTASDWTDEGINPNAFFPPDLSLETLLEGTYYRPAVEGGAGPCYVGASTLTNEYGQTVAWRWIAIGIIEADWSGGAISATVTGNAIKWNNSTSWVREPGGHHTLQATVGESWPQCSVALTFRDAAGTILGEQIADEPGTYTVEVSNSTDDLYSVTGEIPEKKWANTIYAS